MARYRVFRSLANGKFVCAENSGDQPLIANRDRVGGNWEIFEEMGVDGNGNVYPLDEEPVNPPDPVYPPQPVDPDIPPQNQFMMWVADKPFGQQTLLDLEPTMNAAGWELTPPNQHGERTKVHPPNHNWTRVGFGEGYWVWVVQPD